MNMYDRDLNCDGITLAGFEFLEPVDWSKTSLRGTSFGIWCVWKVNYVTNHALLVIKKLLFASPILTPITYTLYIC